MTIDFAQIKLDVADAIAAALLAEQGAAFATLPVPTVALAATYTWNGTTTVTTPDTSEVSDSPSSYIRLDSDGKWFQVVGVTLNVSVTIQDVYNVGIPTGATPSSKSTSPLPSMPSQSSLNDKLGTPIAVAVFDGVKDALDQAEINDVAFDSGNTVGPGVIV